MSISVTESFGKHFGAEVHASYQRLGSKLRGMVRTRSNVKGSSTVFHAVGAGTAARKSRHGKVPVMNTDHRSVTCTLQDYYAGDWVDKLDEFKISFEERHVIADAGAYALGRKTDELIIHQLDENDSNAAHIARKASTTNLKDSDGLTKAKILLALEMLGQTDVPDDGQRYAVIGWKQWSQLLEINEFKNADYVGTDELPWKGTQAKRWLGTMWIPHSGLTVKSSYRICHWFHKTAIAHASGQDVTSDVSWHGDRAAFFISNMMSQGAALVDPKGSVVLRCKE